MAGVPGGVRVPGGGGWVPPLPLAARRPAGGRRPHAAPTLSAITADAAPPGQLGAAMGFMRTLTDLGIVSGPILTGIVVDRMGYGYAGGLLAAAAVLAVATVVFAFTKRVAASS